MSSATSDYIRSCRLAQLAPGTIASYSNILHSLVEHCARAGVLSCSTLRLRDLEAFLSERQGQAASTKRKEITCLRSFFRYCQKHSWVKANAAADLKVPKDYSAPTMPYEPDEIRKLLAATDQISNRYASGAARARLRARSLLLLMLYGGMRVSDAIRVSRKQLGADGRLRMRAMKTGVDLYVRLHPSAVNALNALPVESGYFLWSGRGSVSSATGSARRTVSCVAKLAGVPARPHRFRDTFAVELLLHGEDIRTVQLLLGHSSVRTTERHYAPYVARFQERLDRATELLDFE